jgi:hypothetical protein
LVAKRAALRVYVLQVRIYIGGRESDGSDEGQSQQGVGQ